jgi:hypothetical protein
LFDRFGRIPGSTSSPSPRRRRSSYRGQDLLLFVATPWSGRTCLISAFGLIYLLNHHLMHLISARTYIAYFARCGMRF